MSIIETLKEQLDRDALEYLKLARARGHGVQIVQTVIADGTVAPLRVSIDTRRQEQQRKKLPPLD